MAGEIRPFGLVVANTGPIVAALLAECMEALPGALSKIHIVDAIDFETARKAVELAKERGQYYSEKLVAEFSHTLELIRQDRGGI